MLVQILETTNIMEYACARDNLNMAYKRVVQNKGVAVIDGMPVTELGKWLKLHGARLISSLLDGTYKPEPVKRVSIPKPNGGIRHLGIPMVIDQVLLQVLTPVFDKIFSEQSYGFRPGRSAHDALEQAGAYVKEGRGCVVDIDPERYFDTVNHVKPCSWH